MRRQETAEYRSDTIRYHTIDEIKRLLKTIDSIRDRAIFTVAYYHGLRASEVGLLREMDVIKDAGQIHIRRMKRGKIRSYEMSPDEIKAINDWCKIRGMNWGDETPLFVSKHGTNAIGRRQLDRLMKVYGEKAGIPSDKCYFHTLRHSCAVHMIEADIPVLKVRDWLGHRSLQSTLVYTQVSDKAISDAATQFHEYVGAKKKEKDKEKVVIRWKRDKKG